MMTIDDYKSLTDPNYVKLENFYVIAGNYKEYLEYATKNYNEYLDPKNKKRMLFVLDDRTFRGVEDPEGVFIGTWRNRLDIKTVLHALYVCTRDVQKARKIRHLLQSVL